jgi:hypothetical protein
MVSARLRSTSSARCTSTITARGIREISINGEPRDINRVKTRTISDYILTEILEGVGQDLLVFAGITTLAMENGRPLRNAKFPLARR